MAIAYSSGKPVIAIPDTGFGRSMATRLLRNLRQRLQAPDVGEKPPHLCVSRRGWKRHSALLMSVYEQSFEHQG